MLNVATTGEIDIGVKQNDSTCIFGGGLNQIVRFERQRTVLMVFSVIFWSLLLFQQLHKWQ